jgi:hypothetical protein
MAKIKMYWGGFKGLVFQKARAPQRRQKILFHLGEFFPGNRISRHEDEFHRLGQFMLVLSEAFAEQPPGAAPFHRAADFPARDHTEPWRCADGQPVPVGDETALRKPLSLLPHPREIAVLPESRVAAQAQAFRRFGGHDRLDRREAVASDAAAVAQRGLAALARISVKKSVLPFAADFRRLILAFHKSI